MSVRLIEAICRNGHRIMGYAAEGTEEGDEEGRRALTGALDAAIETGAMNPWCHVCGAHRRSWTTRASATPYRTLDEARVLQREPQHVEAVARILGRKPQPGGPL